MANQGYALIDDTGKLVGVTNTVDYGEMVLAGGGEITVDTVNAWQGVNGMSTGEVSGATFDAGSTRTDITTYATYDAGATTKVTTTGAHGLAAGDYITISNTTNYNDIYEVLESVDANNFTIDKAWDTNNDGQGTFHQGSALTIATTGTYKIDYSASCTGSIAATKVYEFELYDGKTALAGTLSKRAFTTTNVGYLGGTAIHAMTAGDQINELNVNLHQL